MKLKKDHPNGMLEIKYEKGAIVECGWLVTLDTGDKVRIKQFIQIAMNRVCYICLFYL